MATSTLRSQLLHFYATSFRKRPKDSGCISEIFRFSPRGSRRSHTYKCPIVAPVCWRQNNWWHSLLVMHIWELYIFKWCQHYMSCEWCYCEVSHHMKCNECKSALISSCDPLKPLELDESLDYSSTTFLNSINRGGLSHPLDYCFMTTVHCWRVYEEIRNEPALKKKLLGASNERSLFVKTKITSAQRDTITDNRLLNGFSSAQNLVKEVTTAICSFSEPLQINAGLLNRAVICNLNDTSLLTLKQCKCKYENMHFRKSTPNVVKDCLKRFQLLNLDYLQLTYLSWSTKLTFNIAWIFIYVFIYLFVSWLTAHQHLFIYAGC